MYCKTLDTTDTDEYRYYLTAAFLMKSLAAENIQQIKNKPGLISFNRGESKIQIEYLGNITGKKKIRYDTEFLVGLVNNKPQLYLSHVYRGHNKNIFDINLNIGRRRRTNKNA